MYFLCLCSCLSHTGSNVIFLKLVLNASVCMVIGHKCEPSFSRNTTNGVFLWDYIPRKVPRILVFLSSPSNLHTCSQFFFTRGSRFRYLSNSVC